MSEIKTYEQWFVAQPPGRAFPRTLDEFEELSTQAYAGSDKGSPSETLAIAVDGLLAELRSRRAADLDPDDVDALSILQEHLRLALERPDTVHREWKERSLSILSRLTGAK